MRRRFERIIFIDDKVFYVPSVKRDFHTEFGFVKSEDLKKVNCITETNTGKKVYIIKPNTRDLFEKLIRGPQIITLKDVGRIIAETGINKKSFVVEAGTGSGALAISLALIAKKVVSYEIRKEFYEIALRNKEMFEDLLSLKNLVIKNKSVGEMKEKNVDVVVFDLPQPWDFITKAKSALKVGGFLVTYLPNITQVLRFREESNNVEGLKHVKTVEILSREWIVDGRRVRPKNQMLGHTAFISFYRRLV